MIQLTVSHIKHLLASGSKISNSTVDDNDDYGKLFSSDNCEDYHASRIICRMRPCLLFPIISYHHHHHRPHSTTS